MKSIDEVAPKWIYRSLRISMPNATHVHILIENSLINLWKHFLLIPFLLNTNISYKLTVKLMLVESGWLPPPPCARGVVRWVYCQSALNADTVTFFPRHPSVRDNSPNVSQPYTPKCHSWLRCSPLLITFLQKYRPAGILLATCWQQSTPIRTIET